MTYDIGYVVWEDACCAHQRSSTEPLHKPQILMTAGWIMRSDKRGVTLGVDAVDDGRFRTQYFIPRAYILKVVVLKRRVISVSDGVVKFPGRTFNWDI